MRFLLPSELPSTWAGYGQWLRTRLGILELAAARLGERFGSPNRAADAFADAVARAIEDRRADAEDESERQLVPGDRLKAVAETYAAHVLKRFLDGRQDLAAPLQAVLFELLDLSVEQIHGAMRDAPPVDVHREAWIDEMQSENSKNTRRFRISLQTGSGGAVAHQILANAPDRAIDTYVREFSPPEDPSGDRQHYVSPGKAFLYVLEGELQARFYGIDDDVRIKTGQALFYDGSHPHSFEPSSDCRVLDVTVNRQGPGQELALRQYKICAEHEKDRSISYFKRVHASVALQSSQLPKEALETYTGIKPRRLKKLTLAEATPEDHEIRALASLFRLAPQRFYRPIHVASVYRHFEVEFAEEAATGARWPLKELEVGDALRPRSEAHLTVSTLSLRSPEDPEGLPPSDHHEDHPGEEILFVLDGELGVQLRDPHDPRGGAFPCRTSLKRGDAIWYSSALEHRVFCPSGPVRALHFWAAHPIPPRPMRGE